jgi:hypothetical protein
MFLEIPFLLLSRLTILISSLLILLIGAQKPERKNPP